ncbi:MAG: hypothetical protein ABIB71_08100 [Candidatus Woesearchaeota archaeon]
MKDHLVTEITQRTQCIYCGNDMQNRKWESEFMRDLHYKSITCECGKRLRLKVHFHGSGHDSWDGTHHWKSEFKKQADDGSLKNLESKIQTIAK